MRLPRIHVLAILLILGLSVSAEDKEARKDADDATPLDEEPSKESSEELDEQDVDEELPILPPIILLDFDNSTDDGNSTSEEKPKRTVNGGLGYGFDRNALHSGKYNYYFPAGKTGTTVSIEESISPFLPKTIIEKVQSGHQRQSAARPYPQTGQYYSSHQNNQQSVRYVSSPSFGVRTKLHKTTDLNSDFYQSRYTLSSTTRAPPIRAYDTSNLAYRGETFSRTTPSPLRYSEQASYVTPSPLSSIRYVTQRPSSGSYRLSSHNSQIYGAQRQSAAHASIAAQSYSTVRPPVQSSTPRTVENPFPNLPRFTVENGIRYENKIFWKYPDGRVSDMPPVTYVETSYSGLLTTARPEPAPTESPAQNYETVTSESGVYSQGPVQFPLSPESAEQQQTSPFISSESISSSIPQQQVYRLGYQNLVGQKQGLNLAQQAKTNSGGFTYNFQSSTASPLSLSSDTRSGENAGTSDQESDARSSAYTDQRPVSSEYTDRRPVSTYTESKQAPLSYREQRPVSSAYSRLSSSFSRRRPVSKYMVNSPNPEYISPFTTENPVKTTTSASLFTPSGEISQNVLSKYTTEAQSYLKKITATKKQPSTNRNADYSNLQYSDLLNYNPSISQYIKNPASILNVHPTFVQTGNSLIPVIILRVDGAPPIQPKSAPNVNLKALLQQYLVQYAKSIQDVEQSSNYDLGPDLYTGTRNAIPATSTSREEDAETQDDYASPYDPYSSGSSYQTRKVSEDSSRTVKYGERTGVRQKVKSVQIIEGPRYSAYNVKT